VEGPLLPRDRAVAGKLSAGAPVRLVSFLPPGLAAAGARPALIAYLSAFVTLEPGDVVRMEVPGIGVLENRIV